MHRLSEADAFLSRIQNLSYQQLLDAVSEEIATTRKRPIPRRADSTIPHYLEFLQGLRFFLESGAKPSNFDDHDFVGLREIAEKLVERGEMKASLLDVFRPPSAR